MMILFAAMLQAAPVLPADTYDAAVRCNDVAFLVGKDQSDPPVADVARAMSFSLAAARVRPDSKPVADRVQEIMGSVASRTGDIDAAQLPALTTLCNQRFPAIARTSVTLPADPLTRDTLCLVASSALAGMAAQRDKLTGGNELAPLSLVMNRYVAKLTEERFKAAGLDPREAVLAQLPASVDVGSLPVIEQSCAALPD